VPLGDGDDLSRHNFCPSEMATSYYRRRSPARPGARSVAPKTVAVSIEIVNILPDDAHRPLDERRSVAAPTRTVDIVVDGNAGFIVGVTRLALFRDSRAVRGLRAVEGLRSTHVAPRRRGGAILGRVRRYDDLRRRCSLLCGILPCAGWVWRPRLVRYRRGPRTPDARDEGKQNPQKSPRSGFRLHTQPCCRVRSRARESRHDGSAKREITRLGRPQATATAPSRRRARLTARQAAPITNSSAIATTRLGAGTPSTTMLSTRESPYAR